MRSLEVLEISNNPFDMATYGEPRSAEELLQALCKQPVPEMYQEEAAQMDVALKDTPRDLLHTIMRYKEGVASIEDFCRKELNVENALYPRPCTPLLHSTHTLLITSLVDFTSGFANFVSTTSPSVRSNILI